MPMGKYAHAGRIALARVQGDATDRVDGWSVASCADWRSLAMLESMTKAQLDADIREYLSDDEKGEVRIGDGPRGDFRVEFTQKSRPSHGMTMKDASYEDVLRATSSELLGSAGDHAIVYLGKTPVAEGYLQYRRVQGGGGKFSVKIVGEKPRKRRR